MNFLKVQLWDEDTLSNDFMGRYLCKFIANSNIISLLLNGIEFLAVLCIFAM